MSDSKQNRTWRVIGKSVRGASHARVELPNQDALGWLPDSGSGLPLIVAASDGHGSAKCFRSHLGSSLAVGVALAVAGEFLGGQPDLANLSAIKRTAEERMPQEIARRWKEAVERDIESNAISAGELEALEKKEGAGARRAVEANPPLAYGATILTVIVTDSFILYLQLGDGDILIVSEAGEVGRPLPKDERLFANETTSLSLPEAWSEFRFGFQALIDTVPALVLLSTDGYANSFRDEDNFLKVGRDLLDMIRAEGVDKVSESIEGWLTEATSLGSGDDTTLAILCRTDCLGGQLSTSPAEESQGPVKEAL